MTKNEESLFSKFTAEELALIAEVSFRLAQGKSYTALSGDTESFSTINTKILNL